jgi:hypothetical protein
MKNESTKKLLDETLSKVIVLCGALSTARKAAELTENELQDILIMTEQYAESIIDAADTAGITERGATA